MSKPRKKIRYLNVDKKDIGKHVIEENNLAILEKECGISCRIKSMASASARILKAKILEIYLKSAMCRLQIALKSSDLIPNGSVRFLVRTAMK